ncbi:MAG: PHB depolymerase family esterase [Tahibacter sp.]
MNAARYALRTSLLPLPLLLAACAAAQTPANLPALKVDPARISVAGLSSGAYMATQSQMAWPQLFRGAALVAGGPYGCADGKLETALGSCMKGEPAPALDALVVKAQQRSKLGQIGPLEALAKARVYVLHGSADPLVATSVSRAAADFYERLRSAQPALSGLKVDWDGEREFGHNLPLEEKGDDCAKSIAPFMGHCGFDAAGAIFEHLYGKPPRPAVSADGALLAFDQKLYAAKDEDALLGDTGYAYVPKACSKGNPCGVMVVFHGCKQNVETVGQSFVRDAGFNRWADVYAVALLYPQTHASFAPLNPQGCWDWWGYSGSDYDTRSGAQQQWLTNALRAMGVAQAE